VKIQFDVETTVFQFVREDAEKRRWYYASGDPRVALRLDGFSIDEIAPGELCDGMVGWMRGDAGYVLPEHTGQRHTKITLKSHGVEVTGGCQMSALLDRAPTDSPRFDADAIANDVIERVRQHIGRLGLLVYVGGVLPQTRDESYCDLRAEIETLCGVANCEVERATADEDTVGEIGELVQDIAALCAPWWASQYPISADWRKAELGRAWDAARFWLVSDDAITLSDAAMLLYGRADAADLNKIDRLIRRQKLTGYIDPAEGNSQRARRVLSREVDNLRR
jgi:hypothetical protein